MAMAPWGRNKHYRWTQIRPRHWLSTAKDCGFPEAANAIFADFSKRAPKVLATVQDEAREIPAAVLDPILADVETLVAQLEN